MAEDDRARFYGHYQDFKDYGTPRLKAKHLRQFDREFWVPSACVSGMAVLEIGCGTGLFLSYLREKGVADFLGIDRDPALAVHVPPEVAAHFEVADIWRFLEAGAGGRRFDRIALFDVLEHFTADEGVRLLTALKSILRPGGRLVIRVPNMSSPWALQYQFGDLTHRAAYTPSSLGQLALAAELNLRACIPQRRGGGGRRLLDGCFHWLLARILANPPEIWSANFVAVLERREDNSRKSR